MDKWNTNNIKNQANRVVIVTGSSSGLGFETARALAQKNATIIMAVRNPQKAEQALDILKSTIPKADISFIPLDLTDLRSIKTFADDFKASFERLDLLINNAGIMTPPFGRTADGFELQMGTNHLGHFALTGLLIDLLEQTQNSRIVNVSSMAHKMGNIDFDDLHWEKRKYKKWNAYGDSKIANLHFTFALDQKLRSKNSHVIAAAAHPGYTATKLQRHTGLFSALNHILAQDVSMGALPTLYAAIAPDVQGGDFFGPSGFMEARGYPKQVKANKRAKDMEIAKKLWDVSQELTAVYF